MWLDADPLFPRVTQPKAASLTTCPPQEGLAFDRVPSRSEIIQSYHQWWAEGIRTLLQYSEIPQLQIQV